MRRRQRTQVIIDHGSQAAITWGQRLAQDYSVETIVAPRLGLLMIKQRETAKQTLFYSGEILMTECKLRYQNWVGLGLVKGDQAELAHALAMIDLAYQAGWPQVTELDAWLAELAKEQERYLNDLSQRYAKTKVDFSTMNQ
ncbi:phosphonate C-P lyase system protein PhnG [Vaginisenegalia massiliensis]|uniref:phosphonate C-P lyase system protein PhnG n=1 Tax=Vaginisenegalia massiliensis TaxID=2058294 RepID=UPI000F527484|nr:phosphonate C-P lyase system protein PhnG [Vaginisenegalia massiliensis]